jgi:hypothetical protein
VDLIVKLVNLKFAATFSERELVISGLIPYPRSQQRLQQTRLNFWHGSFRYSVSEFRESFDGIVLGQRQAFPGLKSRAGAAICDRVFVHNGFPLKR